MEQEIFKIIKCASDNNRVLNRTDVREIFEYLKDSEDLALVCDCIDFESLDGCTLARFLYNINMIIMDLDKIIVNSTSNSIYGINLSIVQSLLHEIEHVKQLKMLRFEKSFDNSHNDIEKILIDSSYDYLRFMGKYGKGFSKEEKRYLNSLNIGINKKSFLNLVKKHKSLYHYAPNERLAEIKSYHIICNMIKHNELGESISKPFKHKLDSSIVRGYEKNPGYLCYYSPSYNYLSNLKLDKNLAQIKDFEDKYLKDDTFNYFRLLYGVHVDEDYLKEKIRKIKK